MVKDHMTYRYQLSFISSYREKKEVLLRHRFFAKNNKDARQYSYKFIEEENKKSSGIQRARLIGLEKIIQREETSEIALDTH